MLKEISQYQYLFWNLVIKELKLRYKKSILGFLWTFLHPLGLMVVYSLVFSQILRFGMKNFHVFLLSGLLPWNFLAASLFQALPSILGNANLIKKIYVPRIIFPLAVVGTNLINLILSLILLGFFLLFAGMKPSFSLLFLPGALIIHSLFTTGVVLLIASITVFFRDMGHILEVFLLGWFFLSPVIYPFHQIKGTFLEILLKFNPMTYIIELYHSIFYYTRGLDFKNIILAFLFAVGSCLLGGWVFKRLEPSFVKKI